MNISSGRLLLYRPSEDSLLGRMLSLQDNPCRGQLYRECIGDLITLCEEHGFSGNLWHCYLAYYLVYHENAYSRSCEIRGKAGEGITKAALSDFAELMKLFAWDFETMDRENESGFAELIRNYQTSGGNRKTFNRRIRDRIMELAVALAGCESPEAFGQQVSQFYGDFGVGKFGLHKAFRIFEDAGGNVSIRPITNIAHVQLEDLVGYETAKQKLIENTEAFVAGRSANNCLLYGDAGTGKSSSIKGILNRYYDRGLRIIEVYKHQFRNLNDVIAQIKNRNYRFILYMDDLSFEEFETEYKYLKAVIEGGLEKKPDNILIYATSNRRHLIRENYSDKEEVRVDMHTSDTVQEKLSLVYRFGVTIYFGSPDKKEFQEIVRVLAQRNQIRMPMDQLLLEANQWELHHGGLSGRTAQQFIDYLRGTRCIE